MLYQGQRKSSGVGVRAAVRCGAIAWAVAGAASAAWAGYEAPDPAYAAPTHYYDAAAGTGLTLRANLHNIITAGFTSRNYGDSRFADAILDQDPNKASNIILLYNRASVPGTWDNGITWNREHVWPKNWLGVTSSQVTNTYKGPASDLFELRPANPNVNSTRSDDGYGFYPYTGTGSYGVNSGYWYPGTPDTGDVARTIFYMATRYFTASNSSRGTDIQNLEVVNGMPSTFNFGDLNSLLHWNYSDGVDNFERRRNQMIYGSSGDLTNHALNPTYYQGNRNPFIDHPEYVWAIFGGGNNNSQISIAGGSANADGSSAATVDLGRVIAGATFADGSVVVNKTGANPTTFDLTGSGVVTPAASALQIGTGQPFDYNNVSKTMAVRLTASTATAGVKTGTVTISNTDLTSSGAGHGSADGDDVVNITGTVVDHSNGSFTAAFDQDAYAVSFEYVPQGFGGRTAGVPIANVPAASGYTAALALNSVTTTGSPAISTNAAPFAQLAAGATTNFTVSLDSSVAGDFTTTTTFNVSDEAIPGATGNAPLVLTTTAHVIAHGDFAYNGTLNLRPGETFSTGPSSIGAGVTLVKNGPGTLNIDGPQSNGAGSRLDVSAGSVVLGTDAGSNLDVVVLAGGSLQVTSAQHLHSLTVDDGPHAVDLLDNPVVLVSADAAALRHSLLTGVVTSTSPDPDDTLSIGYVPSGAAGLLMRLTYTGDANLDGAVNADDFALIDRGFAGHFGDWSGGDFNYDAVVDATDYLLIDRSFALESGGGLSPAFLAGREAEFGAAYVSELLASVPEPGSAALFALSAAACFARRNRRAAARG